MARSLLFTSRVWHRRIGSLLFIFFLLISMTGLMLGWKSMFSTTLYEAKAQQQHSQTWLSLDTLKANAVKALKNYTNPKAPERADIRFKSGYVEFQFADNYYVRLNGETGETLQIDRRYGGWIQDIHSGAIVDSWVKDKGGIVKKIYTSILGLSLFFLALSGAYLWLKPVIIKRNLTRKPETSASPKRTRIPQP